MTSGQDRRDEKGKADRIDDALRALDDGPPTRTREEIESDPPLPGDGLHTRQVDVDRANIDRALEIERGLSGREVSFLESIDDQVRKSGVELTVPQRAWLSSILIRFGIPQRRLS